MARGVLRFVGAKPGCGMDPGQRAGLGGPAVGTGARRGGVGRLLVQAVEEWATDRGLSSVDVRSNVVRPESHPFYKRIGYARSKSQHVYAKLLLAASRRHLQDRRNN